jgi:hypothetical protein
VIKDQYRKVQSIYRQKMEQMQEKLGKETKKMEIAERRRKLELEGYSSDLSAMKKKIQFFHKYIAKMKKAVDEERGAGEVMEMSEDDDEDKVTENEEEEEQM